VAVFDLALPRKAKHPQIRRNVPKIRIRGIKYTRNTEMWPVMKPVDYFASHSVFRFEDFSLAHREGGRRKPSTTLAVLKQHVRAGHLLRVRRGLYATVPRGVLASEVVVDPFVLASAAAPDAVVAYHGALQFHGKAYSLSRRLQFLTATRAESFEFRGSEFVPVLVPATLRTLPDFGGGVLREFRNRSAVQVTTFERTLVDVLDSPRHGLGWEEIGRSLEAVEFFKLDPLIEYALKLGSATTVAKVGFFLEQHRQQFMVEDHHLDRLRERAPASPVYLDRGKRAPGTLFRKWNLIVPDDVLNHTWDEQL